MAIGSEGTGPSRYIGESDVKSRGFLVVLSGPSGVGKNTLLKAILPRVPGLIYSVSATTRPPRPGERHGVDYFFLSEEEFQARIDRGEFLEWAEFCGYRYGTPRAYVEECLARGLIVIMDIDIQGARQVRQKMPDGVAIFVLPPSLEELRHRLEARGADSETAVDRRLRVAAEELAALADYDYWIVNDDLERAVRTLEAIILAERSRVQRLAELPPGFPPLRLVGSQALGQVPESSPS